MNEKVFTTADEIKTQSTAWKFENPLERQVSNESTTHTDHTALSNDHERKLTYPGVQRGSYLQPEVRTCLRVLCTSLDRDARCSQSPHGQTPTKATRTQYCSLWDALRRFHPRITSKHNFNRVLDLAVHKKWRG